MNIENIKNLLELIQSSDYKDLFAAIVLYETNDNMTKDFSELNSGDIEILENIYNKYMNSDIPGLLNEDLKFLIADELNKLDM